MDERRFSQYVSTILVMGGFLLLCTFFYWSLISPSLTYKYYFLLYLFVVINFIISSLIRKQ